MSRRPDHYCRCGHPQSFHHHGHAHCRCGCEKFRMRGRGVVIEILRCIDPGDPPYTVPLFEVRCPPCGRIYQTRATMRDLVIRRSCRECRFLTRRVNKKPTSMNCPADLPAAEKYPHGTRARYVAGCRCEPCTIANREYARMRTKLPPNPLVSAGPARRHLLRLSERGIGKRSVAEVAKVGLTAIQDIKNGTKTRIRKETSDKILAAKFDDLVDDNHLVDAAPTHRLIEKLLAQGFTRTELARRLGSKGEQPALQLKADKVKARNARKVEKLYKSIMGGF